VEGKMMRFALLRQILGLSQREIARKIGITQQSWAELEKQTREMKKKTTLEVLKFRFGVNPDWLLGKSPSLFCDWEKGLEVVKEKVFQKGSQLSRFELLFLLEVMHYVYSNPFASKTSKETRREFVKALVDSIKHLLRYEVKKIENLISSTNLGLFGQDFFEALEAVQKLSPKIQLVRELTSVLISFLRDADFELSEDDEKVLSQFLLPWSFYVAFAYRTIKQNLIPLSSVYFSSSLEELLKFEKKSDFEKLELFLEKNKVYFEFCCDKFDILFKDKLKMTLDISEAFAFFVLLAKAKEVENFSVLGFSIRKDKLAKSIKFTFNQRINVMLDKNEFDDLAELAVKVKDAKVKENGDLWLYLQRACLDRYGFV
jgi:transcriptional regulator with XRE-family HTH domain